MLKLHTIAQCSTVNLPCRKELGVEQYVETKPIMYGMRDVLRDDPVSRDI
jgi:hypothetical protein